MVRLAMILMALSLLSLAAAGCETPAGHQRTPDEQALFGPSAMRIHPIFTRAKDWTGDGQPDGIEALIEFQDAFGDPTKATGRATFELFEYRPDEPDARGSRVSNPWIGSIADAAEQRERWNRTSRTYSFELAYDGVPVDRTYVLAATFELAGGGRFFDRIILEPQRQESIRVAPTTLPGFAAPPTTRPAQP